METQTQTPWSFGAVNENCKGCNHQHQKSHVVGGKMIYSACKVVNEYKDDEGKKHLKKCDCEVRS